MSFAYAAAQPALDAAVVYYGTPPKDDQLPKIHAPISAFYGGDDNRVTSTVKPAEENEGRRQKNTPHTLRRAGHGFSRLDRPQRRPAPQSLPASLARHHRVPQEKHRTVTRIPSASHPQAKCL